MGERFLHFQLNRNSTTKTHFVVDSTVSQDGVHKHTFEDTRDLMDEILWSRIYAGFHYYHSMEEERQLGTSVAREILQTRFLPQPPPSLVIDPSTTRAGSK